MVISYSLQPPGHMLWLLMPSCYCSVSMLGGKYVTFQLLHRSLKFNEVLPKMEKNISIARVVRFPSLLFGSVKSNRGGAIIIHIL